MPKKNDMSVKSSTATGKWKGKVPWHIRKLNGTVRSIYSRARRIGPPRKGIRKDGKYKLCPICRQKIERNRLDEHKDDCERAKMTRKKEKERMQLHYDNPYKRYRQMTYEKAADDQIIRTGQVESTEEASEEGAVIYGIRTETTPRAARTYSRLHPKYADYMKRREARSAYAKQKHKKRTPTKKK